MTAQMTEKIVGILGGMGPEATIDLMRRIMRLTPAKDDVDHIHCIVGMAQRLEACGADFIVIPCNTAHHYHRDVQESVHVPVLNLIELTVDFVLRAVPGVDKVGLLASPAVRITGLYENLFRPREVEVIYPAPEDEERLFRLIRKIKAGECGEKIQRDFGEIVLGLAERGAEVGIIACTELSAVNEGDFPMFVYDASDILARKIVDIVKNNDEYLP